MKEEIKIKYDGEWPCLCMGRLKVWIGETFYDFGKYVLSSGGSVWFSDKWEEHIESGPWSIIEDSIPKNFPKDRLEDLLNVINSTIPYGCCGGCV